MYKTGSTNHTKPIILIAEDNKDNYKLLEVILQQDYQLIHAINGLEAVRLFHKHLPRLILMDIKMPFMDGYEATAEIRKSSAVVPIIALTACAFAEDKERIMTTGFNAYLTKPIDFGILKKCIQKFLPKS